VAAPSDEDTVLGLHETLVRTLTLGSIDTTVAARRHADLVIRPADQGAGILEFHQLDRLRTEGRRAARAALRDAPARLFAGALSTEAVAASPSGRAG
jgi:NTE family protein